jgi:hypothetical protein
MRRISGHPANRLDSGKPALIAALECFAVDDLDIEGQRVKVVNAPEVDPVVPWSRWPGEVGGTCAPCASRNRKFG